MYEGTYEPAYTGVPEDDDTDTLSPESTPPRRKRKGKQSATQAQAKRKAKNRGQPDMEDIEIGDGKTTFLAYGFTLTEAGTLRQKEGTIEIIRRKLFKLRASGEHEEGIVPRIPSDENSNPGFATDDEYNIESSNGEDDLHPTDADGLYEGQEPHPRKIFNFKVPRRSSLLQATHNTEHDAVPGSLSPSF